MTKQNKTCSTAREYAVLELCTHCVLVALSLSVVFYSLHSIPLEVCDSLLNSVLKQECLTGQLPIFLSRPKPNVIHIHR